MDKGKCFGICHLDCGGFVNTHIDQTQQIKHVQLIDINYIYIKLFPPIWTLAIEQWPCDNCRKGHHFFPFLYPHLFYVN